MENREAYRKKIEAKLDEWKAEADKLRAKAKQKQVDFETDYKKELDQIRVKREELKAKLNKLEEAGEGAWKDLKQGVEKSSRELRKSIDKAIKKIS